ncbi:hypothetical protein CANINC_000591 [Pichia inconspicua]|uniref:Elongator complex protein 4 n=1 Tax=Pichia inconspicua TaxID=52247 RepID=A0A4T0X5R8_9ASCO|nr:hypothetical protein CANINC_000591 [[Candida] inconspicua]
MSFRRRGEVVPGRGIPVGNPMLQRTPAVASAPGIAPNRMVRPTKPTKQEDSTFKHPGVKPSIVLSNVYCVSTGSKDIDTVLVHGGLPVNQTLLIEEDGSTDFSGVLVKNYVSEGIVQNRRGGKVVNHCIVVGMDASFGNELSDVYAGNSKERKKKLVQENEGKLSVSNITNSANDLKIAWRYRKDIQGSGKRDVSENDDESKYPEYNHQFDITTKIRPSPGPNEITYIPVSGGYETVLRNVRQTVERELKDVSKMVRIVVPYFLNPMVYGCGQYVSYDEVVRFVFGLKRIVNMYNGRATLIANMSSELYEDTDVLNILHDTLFDGVIRLVPFPHELNTLMEKVYKTQREKIKQGYVDIYKVPILSGLGMMEKRLKEYSFKNGKTSFHVEQWSIPVDEEEVDEKKVDF